eukprot:TRINITY_DN105642_c0_g1_i1.p1 TRINITY_DN105642_c0_g1~~TRINITY_DN105642_c0_g1_i1.p1  ORF type:complete len:825 (+),score=138.53 TRINITY_DN105642_c0_g1_i1:304-2475(+)
MDTPAFVLPLQKLPPRALRMAVNCASLSGSFGYERRATDLSDDPNNSWFALLGPGRLARTSGGDLQGIVLTAQEFVLAALVHYMTAEPPPASQSGSSTGSGAGIGTGTGGSTGTSATPGAGSLGTGGQSGGWSGSGSRQTRAPGLLSSTYERLLLAHLRALLPHREYELPLAQEPRASVFFFRLLHEFLIAPRSLREFRPASLQSSFDMRLLPAPLHCARLVLLHVLANPSMRQVCEETPDRMMPGARARSGRISREMAILGPAVTQMVSELLVKLGSLKQSNLEALTSLTRLWLVLLQPWKAKRLYDWYLRLRPAESRTEPPPTSHSLGGTAKPSGPVDIALVGLEPEVQTGEVPAPLVPKELVDTNGLPPSSLGTGTRLAAAAGLASAGISRATTAAAFAQLVPGDGNPLSWRSYVVGFHGAYGLFEAILSSPLHVQLCMELARHCAGWEKSAGLFGALGTSTHATAWGSAASPAASQLLRQRNSIQALKAIGQVLLCFSDGLLVQVLQEPSEGTGRWLSSAGIGTEPGSPILPLFADGSFRPQLTMLVSLAWAALLGSASIVELQPLLAAVSRQLQHTHQWSHASLPALEDTARHKSFAQTVLQELGQTPPQTTQARDAGAAGAAPSFPAAPNFHPGQCGSLISEAQFVGSEWQRPVRGGELELLLRIAYLLADMLDRLLGREPRLTTCGPVPQTEWPRMFANWKLFLVVHFLLLCYLVL